MLALADPHTLSGHGHAQKISMGQYIALAGICIIGAMLQATIGFGFPVFAMIFLVMLYPFSTAVTITQTAGLFGVAYFFLKYRKHVSWGILIPFLLPALSVGFLLTLFSMDFPVGKLKVSLGFVLIGIAGLFMFNGKARMKPTKGTGLLMGGVSGVLNGLFAVGGPPVALYLLPAVDEKLTYIASANAYFFMFKVISLPIRFSNGSISNEYWPLLCVSLLSMTIGTVIGDKIMRGIPKDILQWMVYSFVAISGILIIVQELF